MTYKKMIRAFTIIVSMVFTVSTAQAGEWELLGKAKTISVVNGDSLQQLGMIKGKGLGPGGIALKLEGGILGTIVKVDSDTGVTVLNHILSFPGYGILYTNDDEATPISYPQCDGSKCWIEVIEDMRITGGTGVFEDVFDGNGTAIGTIETDVNGQLKDGGENYFIFDATLVIPD